MKEPSILVVGLGSAGRRHVENLVAVGGLRIAVCSERRRLAEFQMAGTRFRVFHEYEAALEARPDAVVIANPTSLHAPYVARALEQGCDVYVEKPVATNAEEARTLLEAARERKAIVAVGCQLRFNPCLIRLKMLVDGGRLGTLLNIHVDMGEYLPDYHPEEDYRKSYAARAALGGGVLLTQIHEFNYLHWLVGPFQSAFAVGGRHPELEVDVEDAVTFLLRSPRGFGVTGHMDFLRRPKRRVVTVIGSERTAVWDYYENCLQVVERDGARKEAGPGTPLDRNLMFLDAMRDFLECVANRGVPRTSLAEAMADVQLVDALRESFSKNTLVPVPRELPVA
jgi:predicted dehydrogenase